MRSWLTYIFLSMVACAAVLTSCNNVLDEEGIAECDDRTTVRLTISFGGDGGPMSRNVENNPAPKDDDLDYTTEAQAEIVAKDIYALVVDASGKFLYRIKDLTIKDGPATDGYYTRTLEGTMIQTTQQVKIVLLANLVQDGIITIGTDDDDNKTAVEAIIYGYEGQSITNLYDALIYNYNGTTPWTLTGVNARRIPMWGESQLTKVPPEPGLTLTCYLYRALAKVQIWVNMKEGIDGFEINSITVNNIHTKGYCVSQADADTNSPNYDFDNDNIVDGVRPYLAPWIPNDSGTQNITYGSLNVKTAYSDMIYLPEKENKENDNVTITVNYTYNDENLTGTIHFKKDGIGDRFDIIRNHSYIFNISSVAKEVDVKLIYEVQDYYVDAKVEIPFK